MARAMYEIHITQQIDLIWWTGGLGVIIADVLVYAAIPIYRGFYLAEDKSDENHAKGRRSR